MSFRIELTKPFHFFRLILGLYLAVHFAHLYPWSLELFGSGGLLESIQLNPTAGLFPNVLGLFSGSGSFVYFFVATLILAAFALAGGLWVPVSALYLWYGWACLFNANNLIANPSLTYIGWMLLATAAIAARPERSARPFVVAAWILLGVGYAISGWAKLKSPSWQNGEAMLHVFNNPLARDYFLREWFATLPTVLLRVLTWAVLALELLFLPMIVWSKTRVLAWTSMVALHIGIALTVSFADLTFGMLIAHCFVFSPSWTPALSARFLSKQRRQYA